MSNIVLRLTQIELDGILSHLLPETMEQEEMVFVFAEFSDDNKGSSFTLLEWITVPPNGFSSHSRYHLDLTDETRMQAIIRTHQLGQCLIEWHSHYGSQPAVFSPSDRMGLREFVPHVRWRLGRRPYAAVVVARGSFDALAWTDGVDPKRLSIFIIDKGKRLEPTCLSPLNEEKQYG